MASSGGVSIIGIMAWHGINLNGEIDGGKSSKIIKIGGIAVAKIIKSAAKMAAKAGENGGEAWRGESGISVISNESIEEMASAKEIIKNQYQSAA
jgi:hypothetical protein